MDGMTVAVDHAKTVFEMAVANGGGQVVDRRRLSRSQFTRFLTARSPTRVVMEACGTAHYRGRLAQRHGHAVTLLPQKSAHHAPTGLHTFSAVSRAGGRQTWRSPYTGCQPLNAILML